MMDLIPLMFQIVVLLLGVLVMLISWIAHRLFQRFDVMEKHFYVRFDRVEHQLHEHDNRLVIMETARRI